MQNQKKNDTLNFSTNKKTPHVLNKTEVELTNLSKKQKELGKTCAVLKLTKADLYLIDKVKRSNRMDVIRYVLDNGLTIEDLEKIQNRKHFDPSDYVSTL